MDDLCGDLLDGDIRQRGQYELAHSLFLAWTAAVWEPQQPGGSIVDCANKFGRTFWRVLK